MLLKHSALYLIACGLSGIVNLAAIPILTRLVSPEAYGVYALVVAGVGLFNVVLFRWLSLGLLRFLPAYEKQHDMFLSTVFVGFIVLVGLTGLSAVIALPLLSDPLHRSFVVIGLLLLWGSAFFELNKELVRCRFSPSRYGFLTLVKAIIALGVGGSFAYFGFGAKGLLCGLVLAVVLPGVYQLWRDWRTVRLHLASSVLFRQLLFYGLPLTATFALKFIVNSSDRFLLGYMLQTEATGLYAVSYDLASHSLGIFMMVVNLAAYPLAVSALEKKGKDAASLQLSQNVILLLAISLPAAAGFALLAPNIAEVFLGQSYRDAATGLIPWVILGAFLSGIKSFHFDLSFQLGGYTMGQVWVALAAAVVNVVLNFCWIPVYGLLGAAYATVAAYTVGIVLSIVVGRRIFVLPWPGREALKLALATIGMVLALLPMGNLRGSWQLAAQVIWGSLIFGALLWLLDVGGVRRRLWRILKRT
jgi:O-antigen/teichoic acid export membrane protein